MLSAVTPLLAFPAISSNFGAFGWAAIALGQSFGAAAAVLIELGWGLTGSQRIARASEKNRRKLLAASLATKLVVVPVAVPVAVIAAILAPEFSTEAALACIGSALVGLSSIWFFIGAGSPGKILVTDSIPRLVFVTSAALWMNAGGPLVSFGLALILSSLIALALALRTAGVRPRDFSIVRGRRLWLFLRAQMTALSGRAVSALYIALPVALVGIVAPSVLPVFAAAERLQRLGLSVLQAVPNSLQGWVGGARTAELRLRRAGQALGLNVVLGLISGVGFVLIAPVMSEWIFAGTATLPIEICLVSGLVIFLVCVSRATGGIVLVALKKVGIISVSAFAGAVVGVPAILLLAATFGAIGALLGEVIAEGTVLAVQSSAVVRGIGRGRR
ncbi:hypothetical protein ELQ90_14275 [Labedella phragmitis]|uniref:Polysaccharide biosynthesis protein n=1 Tax=Labedella phragmitis TaxID=2498849 RepID=A0A3S3Z1J5_9MICO|nr:hypothetical protein [Labedella phragmitis]RWZ46601.1 hypothetical protein ELQ90_14275 [Labedella phragmitis]